MLRALAAKDWPGLIDAVKSSSTIDENGCWLWNLKLKDGYAVVGDLGLNRLVIQAKHDGRALGSQAAHHMCAAPRCVNPDHLQPVSDRENIAEMLARKALVSRIRELEDALATLDPDHPLLKFIKIRS